jgi:uncharacterized membrane protein
MGRLFSREFRNGEPIQAGMFTLVPFNQVVRIQIPGLMGGLVWNRPSSILTRTADGQEFVIPIQDVTRQVQIVLFGGAFLASLFYFLAIRLSRRA